MNKDTECLKHPYEPDISVCASCKEHAVFTIDDDGVVESDCCGANSYNTDPDWDMER